MAWKDFFRIKKSKIITYIIIIAISSLVYLFTHATFGKIPRILEILYYILVAPPLILLSKTNLHYYLSVNLDRLGNILILVIGLVLVLLYLYILACIIDWIISKFKSK